MKNQKKPLKIPNNEAKDGTVQKLKKRIKRLETENSKLKSELRSYDRAFKKTTKFLKGQTNDVSLNDLVKGAKEDKSLEEVKAIPVCTMCSGEVFQLNSPAGVVSFCRNIECEYREVKK